MLVPDITEALKLHDEGLFTMVGDLDSPATYARARARHAVLVAATLADTTNTNIAFTVREVSSGVTIVTTAAADESVDILKLAGSDQVLQLGELLGGFMARRVYGGDGRSHVVGQLERLLIAEASAARTELVGRRLRDVNLPGRLNVTVGGIWERGRFTLGGPDTVVSPNAVLLLAGTREQLDGYDAAFSIPITSPAFVVIIGAGRVGQATATALAARGIEYRLVDKTSARVKDASRLTLGDAAACSSPRDSRYSPYRCLWNSQAGRYAITQLRQQTGCNLLAIGRRRARHQPRAGSPARSQRRARRHGGYRSRTEVLRALPDLTSGVTPEVDTRGHHLIPMRIPARFGDNIGDTPGRAGAIGC